MSNEATEMLEWRLADGVLVATQKRSVQCVYYNRFGEWEGWNGSHKLTTGTLQACMAACQEDADKAIQTARGAQ